MSENWTGGVKGDGKLCHVGGTIVGMRRRDTVPPTAFCKVDYQPLEGEMYVRVRRACLAEGMSVREASRVFGLHRDTVRKILAYSVPPGERARHADPSSSPSPA